MHFQISGHRRIPGGYQTFSGSGWGNTAAQAIADAMKRNPELAAWKVWELSATPERPLTITRQEALASLTNGSVDLDNGQKPNGHGATAGANPAAGSFFPTVTSLLVSLGFLASVCVADGGDSISAGFSELHPDALATRAGDGLVAPLKGMMFDSSHHKTAGPAENLSPPPEVFRDRVGLSADLPSVGSTWGVGNFFDRDTVAALLVFGCSIGVLIWAGMHLDRKDDAESAKAIQDITRTYDL